MKTGFFPKLAWTGVKNNRKLYLPSLLTCIGMVMMQYIIDFLSRTEALSGMPGGGTLQAMLSLGVWIIAIFAFFFLNYSNAFLMRRRRKEFGLYNILGMGKKHIAFVLVWETLMTAVIALVFGLFGGVALSKAAELYSEAARKGDENAQYRLGRFYYFGKGVKCDWEEAFRWIKKAARQGHAEAREKLKSNTGIGFFYKKMRSAQKQQKAKANQKT